CPDSRWVQADQRNDEDLAIEHMGHRVQGASMVSIGHGQRYDRALGSGRSVVGAGYPRVWIAPSQGGSRFRGTLRHARADHDGVAVADQALGKSTAQSARTADNPDQGGAICHGLTGLRYGWILLGPLAERRHHLLCKQANGPFKVLRRNA